MLPRVRSEKGGIHFARGCVSKVEGCTLVIHDTRHEASHPYKIVLREGPWLYCVEGHIGAFIAHQCSEDEVAWGWVEPRHRPVETLFCNCDGEEHHIPEKLCKFIAWYESWSDRDTTL